MTLLLEKQSSIFWSMGFSENCVKNCDFMTYRPSISTNKVFGRNLTTIYLYFATMDTIVETKVLVYDKITIISAVGGSLGLFVGFSVLHVGLSFLEKIERRFEHLFFVLLQ